MSNMNESCHIWMSHVTLPWCTIRSNASATSSTYRKLRRASPSPCTQQGSPRLQRMMNFGMTFSGNCRPPYTKSTGGSKVSVTRIWHGKMSSALTFENVYRWRSELRCRAAGEYSQKSAPLPWYRVKCQCSQKSAALLFYKITCL